ncbi:formamidopyrimidine-DNA glycosylase [Agromyces sp. Root81]|uniref:DNA-formamidopyrimidine glycosylase family protein n=1 Tax=Agromyces sp. Root81 TaxID=1736601 RepID=UPI0006FC9BBD|nr:DNA-formamidopyrimidine glycosylase family protein [Agromyces sp. Root81]KRC58663.1 formamidopyrimidine-DNA glycosylase [Agromyces sp. Root81]
MPESPEVEALVEDLGTRLAGREITGVDVVEFRAAKTRSRPPSSLRGERVRGAARRGKHVDLAVGDAQHLVVSLGRHGWARYGSSAADASAADAVADAPPTLVELTFDDGTVVEFTDAGDWVSLGCWVVDDPSEVPAVAKLGPDPADAGFARADFDRVVAGRRKQVKAVLQEQESLAGIGNAYSDEILHLAKISPVVHAAALTEAELDRLFDATVGMIRGATDRQRGVPIDQLKAAKVASMRVHGRAGEACPVCGDTVLDFSFASTTAQYCPTCQTGGEQLPLPAAE